MGIAVRVASVLVQGLVLLSLVGALIRGVIQFLALIRLGDAYLGIFGGFIGLVVGWIVAFLPVMLYYSLFKNFPGLWRRQDVSRSAKVGMTVGLLVVFGGGAELTGQVAVPALIGWLADHNCWAAQARGVTGTRPCLPADPKYFVFHSPPFLDILAGVVYVLAVQCTLVWSINIRRFQGLFGNVTKGTVNTAMLWAASLVLVPAIGASAFHLLWMFPAAFVLAQLSMLVFPFTLLSIPGYVYGVVWCLGMYPEPKGQAPAADVPNQAEIR